MWNNQYGNILQKEFGFYFSSDNAAYPNVWINYGIPSLRALILRNILLLLPMAMPGAMSSRVSSTSFRLNASASTTAWTR